MKAPWFVNAKNLPVLVTQVGPVIVVLFVFLYFAYLILNFWIDTATQKFVTMDAKHDQIYKAVELSNHFLWAECHNQADVIEDKENRAIAHQRCQPDLSLKSQSYLYEIPKGFTPPSFVYSPAPSSSDSSSSAFPPPPSPREAEAIAEEQARTHRAVLIEQGNDAVEL